MPVFAVSLQENLIKISGPDARKFLQGQLTCNMEEISACQSRMAAHCNPQGRMLALGRIYQYQNALYYGLPVSIAKSTVKYLEHYAVFSNLSFTEDALRVYGIAGEKAREILSKQAKLADQTDACTAQDDLLITQVCAKPERFKVIGPSESINQLLDTCQIPVIDTPDIWEQLDIESGLAFLCPETIGKFLPHDIHLPELNGVSFNKGCYIGQEIIARMQFLGKLKKQLWLVEVSDKQALPGQKIIDDNQKSQGEIICRTIINPEKCLALAVFTQNPEGNTYRLENQAKIYLRKAF